MKYWLWKANSRRVGKISTVQGCQLSEKKPEPSQLYGVKECVKQVYLWSTVTHSYAHCIYSL